MENLEKTYEESVYKYLEDLIGRLTNDIETLRMAKDTPQEYVATEAFLLYRLDAIAALVQVTQHHIDGFFNNINKQKNEKS